MFFFFNDPATTETYTLPLHDALPIYCVFLPLPDIPVADTTGAGDAFVAGLITALAQDGGPQRAARLAAAAAGATVGHPGGDRKSTRLNSSHLVISYAVFCLKKKKLRK